MKLVKPVGWLGISPRCVYNFDSGKVRPPDLSTVFLGLDGFGSLKCQVGIGQPELRCSQGSWSRRKNKHIPLLAEWISHFVSISQSFSFQILKNPQGDTRRHQSPTARLAFHGVESGVRILNKNPLKCRLVSQGVRFG